MVSYAAYIQFLQESSLREKLRDLDAGVLKTHYKCLVLQAENDRLAKLLAEIKSRDCARPKRLKEVIHHPGRAADSQCLDGANAYDEYVYE